MKTWIKRLLRGIGMAPFTFRLRERLRGLAGGRGALRSHDGFPIPPARLIVLVTGSGDQAWYTEGGAFGAKSIHGILSDARISPADFQSILDFGCGCGRIIRHWRPLTRAYLYGTDCNPRLIEWCRRNLPFAQFQSNTLEPRLDYADHQFEFAYALSVLTHMPEHLQRPWMDELRRILRPGGYLLITTQGDEYFSQLENTERHAYAQGRMVVRYQEAAGTNLCSVYHPESYVRECLGRGFTFITSRPRGAAGNGKQDMYLLRRPQ